MIEDDSRPEVSKSVPALFDRRTSARVIALAVNGATVPGTLTPVEVSEVCRALLRSLGLHWTK